MRDKFIAILKKWPAVHHFFKFCYWKIRNFQEAICGTKIQEKFWQKRHLIKRSDWQDGEDWIMGYWNSKFHPHRKLLVEKISHYLPLSILEIGSNCGPNLYLIAKKFPNTKIIGIDINQVAVLKGNELFAREGISNVNLLTRKADTLDQFQDKSFDIVFSDAVLMYIGPDKIKKFIKELIRISRKVLIFVEWHENSEKDKKGLGIYHFSHWKRNYKNLLKQFVDEDQIHITKIPEELWLGKDWGELGYVIEVTL